MPKIVKELTALAVSKIKKDGRHAVGGVSGLSLKVAGNSRSWVLNMLMGTRIDKSGKEVPNRLFLGLGSYPEVTLSEARDKARELRSEIKAGINPLEAKKERKAEAIRQQARNTTFSECAQLVLNIKEKELKNIKHIAQWRSSLEQYAFPVIGHLPVNQINKTHILEVLQPIWLEKNETASRLRGRIETILDYAKAKEFRDGDNPAGWKGMLKPLLPEPSKIQNRKHHAALPYADIANFMKELSKRPGLAARALEFSILTVARSGEVRGATWDEIDFENKIWIVPAERMKARKEHRVPLSTGAIKILQELPRVAGGILVFPGQQGKQMSDMTLTAVLKRMDRRDLTQHGFRSTFRDWAGETTSFPREVIEHALAHKLKDQAEAAYQRGDLLQKRRLLMEDWWLATPHE
ncbi:tyrosine-type recombinase/integrase [Marinomonas sp. IMCC 4694]|uniref:tyrosine-type recombinase/integrase n=1 Tax=Marinomonas sp. IMCC 4694 TaxID=2605432 RepID=UPI0011E876B5|nr:site-specific integrase [Marinomonas sp. IMCC 4694]TYL47836.1 tyrosine-type recombinase/integrase [Marinomonas sp. IMCC 4694]